MIALISAAEQRPAETVGEIGLARAKRQLVEHRRDEPVPHVEDRQGPLALEAEAVLRKQRVAVERADAAAVVRRLGACSRRAARTRSGGAA